VVKLEAMPDDRKRPVLLIPSSWTSRDLTRRSMQALLDAPTEKEGQVFWSAEETAVYSTGASAAIETNGLATALLKWGQASGVIRLAKER
jgi:hypothetical protein